MRDEPIQRDVVEYYEEIYHNKSKVMQVIYDAFGDPIYVPPGQKKKVIKGRVRASGPVSVRRLKGDKEEAAKVLGKKTVKEAASDTRRRRRSRQDKARSRKSPSI